jgi:hypothetical protein
MIKTTGAEWKAFMNDSAHWGECCVEEEIITVNGREVDPYSFDVETVADTDNITVDGGYVTDQAKDATGEWTLPLFFNKWRKAQSTAYLAVEVPKDKADAVREAIKTAGGKVK